MVIAHGQGGEQGGVLRSVSRYRRGRTMIFLCAQKPAALWRWVFAVFAEPRQLIHSFTPSTLIALLLPSHAQPWSGTGGSRTPAIPAPNFLRARAPTCARAGKGDE